MRTCRRRGAADDQPARRARRTRGLLVWNARVVPPSSRDRGVPCADASAAPTAGRQKRPSRSDRARRRSPAQAVRQAERSVSVSLPSRRFEPERVVAHLGPTNSGKTYAALRELADKRAGVYAGPLRMLAQEAHRRLGEWIGAENVGLVTGEERVNEHAPVICSTVEMAPHAGELLVLDEVQWADDTERGSAWTRLLLAGEYREILLLGALDALPLVERAFPEHELKVFERKLPLEFVGARTLRSLTPGTVVVAFSRRAVLALAGEVNRLHPGKVAVLYGAMPLSSRREEIERFVSGAAEVCVATDVLGHGVNLPCETLLFAETTKFDGEERRDLLPWELAQIAGRAGRFGLVERGHVGVLSGLGWGTANAGARRVGARAARPAARRSSRISRGRRGADSPTARRPRRRRPVASGRGARRLAPGRAARVGVRELARSRVAAAAPSASAGGSATPCGAGSAPTARGHLEARQRTGRRGQRRAARNPRPRHNGDRVARPQLMFLLDTARLRGASLEDAERAGREASILRWFALQYADVGGVTIERAAALEEAAAQRVVARLRVEVESPTIGRCRSCGRSCAPWFPLCDRCAGIASRA